MSVAGVFDGIEGIADDYGDDKKKESSDLADSPSKKVRVKSPIKAKWLLPIVHSSIADKPNISYKEIYELLKVCAAVQLIFFCYCLTNHFVLLWNLSLFLFVLFLNGDNIHNVMCIGEHIRYFQIHIKFII